MAGSAPRALPAPDLDDAEPIGGLVEAPGRGLEGWEAEPVRPVGEVRGPDDEGARRLLQGPDEQALVRAVDLEEPDDAGFRREDRQASGRAEDRRAQGAAAGQQAGHAGLRAVAATQ